MNKELILNRILPIAIILIYIAGMVLMIFGNFGNGITLWVVSTVAGALLLYAKRKIEKRRQDEAQVEEEERIYQENQRRLKEKN